MDGIDFYLFIYFISKKCVQSTDTLLHWEFSTGEKNFNYLSIIHIVRLCPNIISILFQLT